MKSESDYPLFRALAITAGEGNGWSFGEDVLQQSVQLWQGVEVYIDHLLHSRPGSRSIRDLAGICREAAWDSTVRGVALVIEPVGPAGGTLADTGCDWLSQPEPRPKLGFSADLSFSASGKDVSRILQIHSLDLVTSPARGGKFIAIKPQLKTTGEQKFMTQKIDRENSGLASEPAAVSLSQLEREPAAAAEGVFRAALTTGELATGQADPMRQQFCTLLLDSNLASAGLPAPIAGRIRQRFSGRLYDPQELIQAVEDGRRLTAELSNGSVVHGPGRISQMMDSRDQLQAACDDLLGAPRETGMTSTKTAKLTGIRELYLMLTGDDHLHGGFYPERVRLATTADFSGLVKNSLNKVVANRWEELGLAGYDWWQRISTVEHFNTLNQITGTLVGTVGSLPEVAEGAAYTELVVGDSPETADWKKYGGYIPLTLELIDRDETRKLRAYPRELAAAGLRKVSALVAALFTQSGGIGPNLADGGALFNNTAVTTAGGHKNLLTTALSAAEWETVSNAVFNQPLLIKNAAGVYGTGPRMAVAPKYLMVPRQLQLTAMKVLYPSLENAANIYSENQQRGQPGDVVTVPEWTDANDWAAVVDPRIAPAIFIGERFGLMPEVFIAGDELSPAVFTNDEHRLKVRHFIAVWVNDFRPLHKSNVA